MSALPLKSTFALLDVTVGRSKLRNALDKKQRIEVVIRGTVDSCWGPDDGVSQEFQIDITSLKATVS